MEFKLVSDYKPTGDQPKAIEKLMTGLNKGEKHQTLLGVTGSGKTFTMANLVQQINKPTLVLAHNKTLAAQLCSEFQEYFPDNAISYFVSYYDYYQPEAYLPATDTYIEKDSAINEEIDKLRHAATHNLLTRKDTLIVASVSAIYGLGDVSMYENLAIELKVGEMVKRDKLLRKLTDLQYRRSHLEFKQGMFHVLGDTVEIFPPSSDNVYRIEFFGDDIEAITEADSFTGEVYKEMDSVKIFPAKHNVTTQEAIKNAVEQIRKDLEVRHRELKMMGKELEAQRLLTRTEYDIEMMLETGYCSGIENYVRYLNNREPGEQPSTLMDYFPDDFLLFIDESHMTIPQLNAMHNGNLNRKTTLVEHGFRLPSCLDNRPLKFSEFEEHVNQVVYISATPAVYEKEHSGKKNIVEQIIRPTGLVDPTVEVRPTKHQIDDLLEEIRKVLERKERVLITTLTKKSAEKLTDYLVEADLKAKYLHSEVDTLERIEVLRDLRLGNIDIVVGINLLREGLDLPEVSLIAILDADKQGFLRSRDALIQTTGRAARNVNGHVIMYGDVMTDAMKAAIDETNRRRTIQEQYNKKHGITPQTIVKAVKDIAQHTHKPKKKYNKEQVPAEERKRLIEELSRQMELASDNLEFEKAAELRDQIEDLSGF
ncbi:excinuclease ABC subunit UvrB [Patescibacteria group bacterium]|nr:excinuclease ABC subunit UvrB [Patescibacteria group bacterium]MBU1016491.1 excinuclease ABC subunit UvrB [Patescibacteria group bacterium]MBU1685130.1 excinuclease ABC subunit UvrB [Patescibacteria group bacterium]MBU1938630.1 excinuclease ABC subunit UvrB [Patescibacteria group bacterium]